MTCFKKNPLWPLSHVVVPPNPHRHVHNVATWQALSNKRNPGDTHGGGRGGGGALEELPASQLQQVAEFQSDLSGAGGKGSHLFKHC